MKNLKVSSLRDELLDLPVYSEVVKSVFPKYVITKEQFRAYQGFKHKNYKELSSEEKFIRNRIYTLLYRRKRAIKEAELNGYDVVFPNDVYNKNWKKFKVQPVSDDHPSDDESLSEGFEKVIVEKRSIFDAATDYISQCSDVAELKEIAFCLMGRLATITADLSKTAADIFNSVN